MRDDLDINDLMAKITSKTRQQINAQIKDDKWDFIAYLLFFFFVKI